MAISYNIYANDGQGGDVDYSTLIAITSSLSYATGTLAAPGAYTFAVRAFETVSGIEEANTDVKVRIVLDSAGNDVTAQPNAVVGLSAWPTAGGTCWVSWGYDSTGQGGPPSVFNVSVTTGPTHPLANPATSVAYLPGVAGYGCTLSGLPADVLCTIAVQAVGSSSLLLGPVVTVPITYFSTSLSNVDSLNATPMP
jgi:hypothetical protein